ncbi:major capsid protein, partial [Hymenobacter terricola]|uniref:major capsid protein n=1 Tax=Hymenobacter terricola TaxID=2819236 RepID=UPI001CF4E3E8
AAAENQTLKWNLPTSNPIADITGASVQMASETGYKPNTLVLSPFAFNALKNHEDILDRIKYTQKGIVTADLLATLFEVDNVYVAWGVVNTAAKGAAEKIDFIMGKHALLCYVNPRPALRKPSAGYIFAWTGLEGSGAYGNR